MKLLVFLLAAVSLLPAATPDEKGALACLEAYRTAMMKRDGAALEKIFHKDITYSHSNGRLENKAEAIAAATKGTNLTEIMDFSDLKVRVYGNTAIIRGDAHIKSNTNDLKLNVLYVFLKTAEGWQMTARQSTRYLAQ